MDANRSRATDSQREAMGLEGTDLLQLSGVVSTSGPETSPQPQPSHHPSASAYQVYNSSGWSSNLAFYDRNGGSVGEYDDHVAKTVGTFGSGDHVPSNIAQFQNVGNIQTLNTTPYFNCGTQNQNNVIAAVTGGTQPHPTAINFSLVMTKSLSTSIDPTYPSLPKVGRRGRPQCGRCRTMKGGRRVRNPSHYIANDRNTVNRTRIISRCAHLVCGMASRIPAEA